MEKYIEVNDRRYYYRDGGTYTETGELVPEGEALVLHFRATGRTPLTTGEYTQLLKDVSFKNFDLFLDNLPEVEQRDQVRIAIESLKERIKFLSKTSLAGAERIKTKIAYEDRIEALEQRLQGNGEKDWRPLYRDLIKEYITDCSPDDWQYVMKFKRLPDGKERILWVNDDARCALFGKVFNFSFPQLNACFRNKKGRKFILSDIPKAYRKNPDGIPPQELRKYYGMLETHKKQ